MNENQSIEENLFFLKAIREDERRTRPATVARTWDPSEQGVFTLLDPYLTTYNKEHRRWRK